MSVIGKSPVADVLIVGAGPSGSALAFLLAGRGWRVELLDRARFPRSKPCGECLNPGAVSALQRLGLLDSILELSPVPLEGWRIRTGKGNGAIGRFGPEVPEGFGISRAGLDHALVRRAVARGVRLEEGVRVLSARPGSGSAGGHDGAPVLETIDGSGRRRPRTARFIVGADGLRSVVARRLHMVHPEPGLRKISLTCRLRGDGPPRSTGLLHLADGFTVGLAPVENAEADGPGVGRLWNGTVVVDAVRGPELKGNAKGFFRDVFEKAQIRWNPDFDVVGGPWPCGPFDWPARRVFGVNHLLVGDAAGYYDPLTGQGIYRALRSAELAAPAVDRCLRDGRASASALTEYATLLERNFRPGRRVQHMIEGVVSRNPLREAALSRIGSTPGSLDALIRVTGDVAPARSLLRPGLLLALLGVPGVRLPVSRGRGA